MVGGAGSGVEGGVAGGGAGFGGTGGGRGDGEVVEKRLDAAAAAAFASRRPRDTRLRHISQIGAAPGARACRVRLWSAGGIGEEGISSQEGEWRGVEVEPAAEWMRSPAASSWGSRSWGRHHSWGMAAARR